MCFLISLFPATFWAAIGFVVVYIASKSEGGIGTFGRVLGIWAFIIAAGILAGGAYITLAGFCSMDALQQCCGGTV